MKRSNIVGFQAILLSLLVMALSPVRAQISDRQDGMSFVPDVYGQFRSLTERADALGFHRSTSPDPSGCRHYQGLVRVDGADGTPFFLVTRSGNTPALPGPDELFCDDSPGETRNGHLIVFKMGSRNKTGERMRSNRLRKGLHVDDTLPPAEDTATIYFTVVDGGLVFRDGSTGSPPPNGYQHPGGMQLVGKMLAIAVEAPRSSALPETQIMFFDVSDPEAPVFKSQFAPRNSDDAELTKAGVVAITPLPSGHYLMAVAGGNGDTFFFYRSTHTSLADPALSWNFVGTSVGPSVEDPHQTLNFIREGNINGDLYLAGARGHVEIVTFFDDRERLDLYRVQCDTAECFPGESISITVRYNGQRITPRPSTGGGLLANLAAASGFHISPSGELIFYATEHDNDGPSGIINAGEWRHQNIVREGSPTLLPNASVNGPYVVNEGSSVSMSGSAGPPTTKAFIQLFQDTDFRSLYPVVDYDDRGLDDFDNFFVLEGLLAHNDRAQSWNWYAPQGCSIEAIDRTPQSNIDEIRTLTNSLSVLSDANLTTVLNDGGTDNIDQEIDRINFLSNCDTYYGTSFALRWDLDRNGSYETSGSPVSFNATVADGPSTVNVPVQARHPSGGPAGDASAQVSVRNVAPLVTSFKLVDSFGFRVGTDVPFALGNVDYRVEGSFTDPGRPDHQTSELNFGDGTVTPNTGFDLFTDAFGGVSGAILEPHTYKTTGPRQLGLLVADDDGGQTSATISISVATAVEALNWIVTKIDARIAVTANHRALSDLRGARRAIAGHNGCHHGAISKLSRGRLNAALVKIRKAIADIQRAESRGAGDLALVKAYLGSTAEAVAHKAYQEAVVAIGPPTPNETSRLLAIRRKISDGHAALIAENYQSAINLFRDAIARSRILINWNGGDDDDDNDCND